MSRDAQNPAYHEDRQRFRDALSFTESDTGFSARLVEKDYYCSLILIELAGAFEQGLLFKGGTCLSKVHMDFYRLSEDLDFVIPADVKSRRSYRRKRIATVKQHLDALPERLPCFQVVDPLVGFNLSRQYTARFSYRSIVTGQEESIKLEIGMREPVLEAAEQQPAHTLLVDPFRQQSCLPPIAVTVLSFRETYAEKLRAALTRRTPAIRDFFDIDHAVGAGRLKPADDTLLDLVRQKLTVPGNDRVDTSDDKRSVLDRQVESELKPVLRLRDYERFDLARAFQVVAQIAEKL